MTAELVRGQNHPLPGNRLEIRVSAGTPVVAAVTLGDEAGRVVADGPWLAHPGEPHLVGVEVPRQAAAEHRLAVDLAAMPPAVHRVHVLLALPGAGARPGAPADFGAAPAPHLAVTTPDGTAIAGFTITGLSAETALLAVELYRRQSAWKVRAVGQGYQGGLPALFLDQGVPDATEAATAIHTAAHHEQSRSIPAPAPVPPRSPAPGGRPSPGAAGPRDGAPAPGSPGAAHGGAIAPASGAAAGRGGAESRGGAIPPAPSGAGSAGGTPPAGGGVDYRHPRRHSSPPPAGQGAVPPAQPPAGQATPAQAPQARGPVAGDAAGGSMEERLYNQVWGMFEDLARTVAAYRSAADFAESRFEQELDRLLADPRTRGGPAAEAAREEAQARQAALVDQARLVLDRDLAQLAAEAEVVDPALPPEFAGWENPAWHAYRVPDTLPLAVRLGSLSLPEAPELRIPLLSRLPLERGLWVDSAEHRRAAMDTAVAVAARLLASHPVGTFAVHALDPAGSGAAAFAPLYAGGALVLPPPAAGMAGVSGLLTRLTERVDLIQMARRGGVADDLPPGFDTAEQLLIVNEFPYGFDDRSVNQLRYLADEGPSAGVHLLLVADREDAAAYGPVLDPLWRSLLRLTPLPSDHLCDPWVGHAWTYEPPTVPPGSRVLTDVLGRLAAARPAFGP
ncbi:TerD family protein [Actinacidiphila epipremni]|uniref:Export associated protein n=1 Tax=Actinacidiphila epipremni TaxID=2053013 RepID=A0ABX0ZRU1_9ACTN|nr:TerD family protein [Actinacidiphila epipremni]NJP45707.1 export associated protein [Actinacidiphila epipremni]